MTSITLAANPTSVGAAIKMARAIANMDQATLADDSRVARPTMSNYERGRSEPPFSVLVRIARATGQPLEFFASAINDEEPAPVGTGSAASYTPRDLNPEPTD